MPHDIAELKGLVFTPEGFVPAALSFNSHIQGLKPVSGKHVPPYYIVPGFIDVHVHGGGGGDAMDGMAGIQKMAALHASHGTTSFLPTTITHPLPEISQALHAIALAQQYPAHGASVLGAHLEGPFISPRRLGAQPDFAVPLHLPTLNALLARHIIKVITLAPETEGAWEAIPILVKYGVRISIGHTCADFALTQRFIQAVLQAGGVVSATHVYNAMGGLSGRDSGALGAILAQPECYAELILDLIHTDAGSFQLAHTCKPRKLMLITDAMRGTGMADGISELGGQTVQIHQGKATLADGTLAGSVLTLDQALRHAVQTGLALEQVIPLLTSHPAQYLGLRDRGKIARGQRADMVVLDNNLHIHAVYVGGKVIGREQ